MKKVVLLLIVSLAFILRFYKLGSVPVSLYWDETAIGYNAYTISRTGTDEYGTRLPLLFRSFDDYKLPTYIYLTAVSVKIFGLNEIAVRLPSALAGVATVLVIFLLTKKYLIAFLFAVSPWSIQFSRAAFEANLGLFFLVLGVWLFKPKKKVAILLSLSFFVLSVYTYRSFQIVTPFIVAFLLIKNWSRLVLFAVIAVVPIYWVTFANAGQVRMNQVSVFNNVFDQVVEQSKQAQKYGFIGKIIFNRRVVYTQQIALGYIKHFSPDFLFLTGDGNGRHGVAGMGVEYRWELPFLIFGLVVSIRKRTKSLWWVWLLVAPIPAALAVPVPHALRSLALVPPILFFVALGVERLKKIWLIVIPVVLVSLLFYLHSYYSVTPVQRAGDWADGYKQMVQYVQKNAISYDKIIVTGHYWKPYIYFDFYYPEASFKSKLIFGGVSWGYNEHELDGEDLRKLAGPGKTLVILTPTEWQVQQEKLTKITEIDNLSRNITFIIGTLKV